MIARKARANRTTWLATGAALATGVFALGTAITGCATDKSAVTTDPNSPVTVRVETLDHEACDEAGHRVESFDTNNDGKSDVKKIYDRASGKELCRATDVDHDGRPDMYEYFDTSGNVRRREAGYDQGGVVDAIEIFEGGKLVKRMYDTTGQHRVDTWDYFDSSGKLARRERDSTNDGRIDQWWTFGKGDKVTIAIDRSGDGKPDPADTVVIGAPDDDQAQAKSASTPPAASVDAGPPPKAAYVPAGMDAGSLAPLPAPVAPAPSAVVDAGPPAPKAATKKKKKGSK